MKWDVLAGHCEYCIGSAVQQYTTTRVTAVVSIDMVQKNAMRRKSLLDLEGLNLVA